MKVSALSYGTQYKADRDMQVVRARTSCGRRLIGVQIPAKLAVEVKRKVSAGPPFHAIPIDLSPPTTALVLLNEATGPSPKQRKLKKKRDAVFSSLAALSDRKEAAESTESEDENSDEILEQDETGTKDPGMEDLLSSGLWQADKEAEALYVSFEPRKVKSDQRMRKENHSHRNDSRTSSFSRTRVDGETETESDDDVGQDDSLNQWTDAKGVKSGRNASDSKEKSQQDASALMMDKALTCEAKKLRVRACARQSMKETAACFLTKLLAREELAGSMAETSVKKAIRTWIPSKQYPGGTGEKLRFLHLFCFACYMVWCF
jgi:hypothetical protein